MGSQGIMIEAIPYPLHCSKPFIAEGLCRRTNIEFTASATLLKSGCWKRDWTMDYAVRSWAIRIIDRNMVMGDRLPIGTDSRQIDLRLQFGLTH